MFLVGWVSYFLVIKKEKMKEGVRIPLSNVPPENKTIPKIKIVTDMSHPTIFREK